MENTRSKILEYLRRDKVQSTCGDIDYRYRRVGETSILDIDANWLVVLMKKE